jgi:hypothetical protein
MQTKISATESNPGQILGIFNCVNLKLPFLSFIVPKIFLSHVPVLILFLFWYDNCFFFLLLQLYFFYYLCLTNYLSIFLFVITIIPFVIFICVKLLKYKNKINRNIIYCISIHLIISLAIYKN